jgi:hypothetical protein
LGKVGKVDKLSQKFICKCKASIIASVNLYKKTKTGGVILSDTKTDYKAVCYYYIDRINGMNRGSSGDKGDIAMQSGKQWPFQK